MKIKKTRRAFIIFLMVFMASAAGVLKVLALDKNSASWRNTQLLYIFDTGKKETLTKTIERTAVYKLKALIRPKTTSVKCKYTYPLEINAPSASVSFEISKSKEGLSVTSKPGSPAANLIFTPLDNLKIDTYCYPYFYLLYQSEAPLNINLHFYADIDNDGTSDFVAYYGKEPGAEITSQIKCYPILNYIEHKTEAFDKTFFMQLYNELRLKRSDRISFILRRMDMEIETTVEGQSYVLNAVGLYNEEPRDVSAVMKEFVDLRKIPSGEEPDYFNAKADLYSFMEEKGEMRSLLQEPLFEISGQKYYLDGLEREKINEALARRTEVELGVARLKEGDKVTLTPHQNKYLELENVFLGEEIEAAGKEPGLTFNRINPTRYIVDVEAENSFWITLSENFHSGWKAYIVTDESNFGLGAEKTALQFALNSKDKIMPVKEHRVVNAFANGWFVPVEEIFKGRNFPVKFKMIMEFYPQRFYEAGLIISGAFFVLMLIWIIVALAVKSRKSKDKSPK